MVAEKLLASIIMNILIGITSYVMLKHMPHPLNFNVLNSFQLN